MYMENKWHKKSIYSGLALALMINITACKKKTGEVNPEIITPKITPPSIVRGTLSDSSGKTLSTLSIANQVWMEEDLKVTTFNDGTPIPLISNDTVWSKLSTPGRCFYNNNASFASSKYGMLYNWSAVNSGKLCPIGWHVPSDNEWQILTNYLGSEAVAGGKMKEQGTANWKSPNTGGTNETNFGALPGGLRYPEGMFENFGKNVYWWSSTAEDTTRAWARGVSYDYGYAYRFSGPMKDGFCVRCIKN